MMQESLTLISPIFKNEEAIPTTYTCDGRVDCNPPLTIAGVPDGAKSLVLIMDDPDIPQEVKLARGIEVFDHWTMFNIPPTVRTIGEGEVPPGAVLGANSLGNAAYTGPCPPPQYNPREHRYFFYLYALDTMLELPVGATKEMVKYAMSGHVLAETRLMGRYKRV